MVTPFSTAIWTLIVLSVMIVGCRSEQQAVARPLDRSARDSGRTAESLDVLPPQAQPESLYYGATASGEGWLVF